MLIPKNHYCLASIVLVLLCVAETRVKAQSSVLSTGIWIKGAISTTGVYRVSYSQLKSAGLAVDNINPRTLKVYTNPGGMLPQRNADVRPQDLVETAIVIVGEADGIFNSADYVLFYAQGPDKQQYQLGREIFFYEQNLYDTKNYVFITAGGDNGKRIQNAQQPNSTTIITTFQDVVHYERSFTSILKSGREWFGERFDDKSSQIFSVPLSGIVSGSTLKIVSDVVAYSLAGSAFKVMINGNEVGTQQVASVPNSRYGIKARHKRDTFSLSAESLGMPLTTNQSIQYSFTKSGTSSAYGHLDFFTLSCTRKLQVYGSQTAFRSAQSLLSSDVTYRIENAENSFQCWEVTDPSTPQLYTPIVSNGIASISAFTQTLKEFVGFNQALSVQVWERVKNQNLHGLSSMNLLIVTDAELEDQAQRLANHRITQSGIQAQVVTTNEVYNEFSGGRADVSSVRDLARFLKIKYPQDFNNLLLFGKGSYDYKNVLSDNINRVFTYESRNSLSPLETYSSDDYFGLLEDSEGEWKECFSCDETLDIGVGRIPISKKEQAGYVVDKIIDYESLSNTGSWQTRIAFVADDGDFNTHQSQADLLANYVESIPATLFTTTKIYVDAFEQLSRPAGQVAPDVNTAIANVLEKGALVVNYTGHGNEYQWADEKILDELLLRNSTNTQLPFFVTATCEFGRHDDPLIISVAEVALLQKTHGVIGLVTTTRPVNASTNFELNQAFYQSFFSKTNGAFRSIGAIFRQTKNTSTSGVSNRNFSLLADPSMTLAFPMAKMEIESITTAEDTDTLKALSSVQIVARVMNNLQLLDTDFNGIAELSIYDKPFSFKTLGNENAPFNYKQWSSLIFRGKAEVIAGKVQFNFIVPKNIVYAVGNGRLSLFASNESHAAAVIEAIKIGGSSQDFSPDTTPPQVFAYINDTTFVQGGRVSKDATLVVRLFDNSGINVSNYGIGNDLIGVLNDDTLYELSDYYSADENTFKKGTIRIPLRDLPPGKHRIAVNAWDTHNNPGSGFVDFVVSDGNEMIISEFGNYPNPFDRESILFFSHNTAGEDLQVDLEILNNQGRTIRTFSYQISESSNRVALPEVYRNNLPAGIYLSSLLVRSNSSGKQARATTKLIIVN